MLKPSVILISVVLILFAGCASQKNADSYEFDNEGQIKTEKEVSSHKEESKPYQPDPVKEWELIHTVLSISPNMVEQSIDGTATLYITPFAESKTSLKLDAKNFKIASLETAPAYADYRYDSAKLTIQFDSLINVDDTVTIKVIYHVVPGSSLSSFGTAITDDRGFYFVDPEDTIPGKPTQFWTQGEVKSNSNWFPTIDEPNQKTTSDIIIKVDSGWVTLSNGILVESIIEGAKRIDRWKMDLSHAPYLVMVAGGKFAVVEGETIDSIPLRYFVEEKYAAGAKEVFGRTGDMLRFFQDTLNVPYPWQKYDQIVVRDFVSGAMENTTASVFMEALQIHPRELVDNDWDNIIAHELMHQWFGNLITCESWSQLVLNEGFATLGEYLWRNYYYGVDEAESWYYDELQQYLSEAQYSRKKLIRNYYHHPDELFDAHSYSKGGMVLINLMQLVGKKAFFKGLTNYLKSNSFGTVMLTDLQESMEATSGMDLLWYFDQWFETPGHPELLVNQQFIENTLYIEIEQKQSIEESTVYRLPLKLALIYLDGSIDTVDIELSTIEQSFKYTMEEEPVAVIVDWDGLLPGKISHPKPIPALAYQLKYAKSERHRYEAMTLLGTDYYNNLNREIIWDAVDHPHWGVQQVALEIIEKEDSMLTKKNINKLISVARDISRNNNVRASAVTMLINAGYMGRSFYESLMEEYSSALAGAAMYGYFLSIEDGGNEVAIQYKNSDIPDFILPVAFYYTRNSNYDQLDWIITRALDMVDSDRWIMCQLASELAVQAPGYVRSSMRETAWDYYHYMVKDYDKYYAYQLLLTIYDQRGDAAKLLELAENEPKYELREMLTGIHAYFYGEDLN